MKKKFKTVTVIVECESCKGTGLYQGFVEKKDEAVVCVNCHGQGGYEMTYRPYTRRKGRQGIKRVRYGTGLILDGGFKLTWFPYKEFQKTVPPLKVKR